MALFNQLLSIVATGIGATLLGLFIIGNLSYLVRNAFTFKDPNLGWDPSAGFDSRGWYPHYRAPNLDGNPTGIFDD